ncbi:MAG: hypothetical protein PGN26_15320 [Xylophilus ampelinus]
MGQTKDRIGRSASAATLLLAAALAAGCASQRISSALERYGVPPDKADCVGDSLTDRLTIAQLQSLSKAAKAYRAIGDEGLSMTLFDLARVAAELRDPVIPLEVVRAGVRCTALPPGSSFGR